jgi:hypothetical protein
VYISSIYFLDHRRLQGQCAYTEAHFRMDHDRKDAKATVEKFESLADAESYGKGIQKSSAMGTVTISDLNDIFLVPAPSADPRGMLRSISNAQCGADMPCRSAQHAKVEENHGHRTLVDM